MEFIIERFIKNIERDYRIKVIHKRDKDGSHRIYLSNIPIDLRNVILNLQYIHTVGFDKVSNAKGEIIREDPINVNEMVAFGVLDNDGNKGICMVLDINNYAYKINKIDYAIRRYFEKHSLIDDINGKH